MINRLKEHFEEPEERPPAGDYFVVSAQFDDFYVSRETAEDVLRTLECASATRWVRFTDINGARVCLRARLIQHVRECTRGQRAAEREFHRARRREDKADRRPWEDDD